MNSKNIALSILAVTILIWVLVTGLHSAWIGMKALKFGFILLAFVGVGWFWGRLSK